jgi:hypothetical protein
VPEASISIDARGGPSRTHTLLAEKDDEQVAAKRRQPEQIDAAGGKIGLGESLLDLIGSHRRGRSDAIDTTRAIESLFLRKRFHYSITLTIEQDQSHCETRIFHFAFTSSKLSISSSNFETASQAESSHGAW